MIHWKKENVEIGQSQKEKVTKIYGKIADGSVEHCGTDSDNVVSVHRRQGIRSGFAHAIFSGRQKVLDCKVS